MGITEEMYKNEIQWCCPQKESPYYIYTMFVKSTARVYVGHTNNPVRRLKEHIMTRGQYIQEDTKSLDNVVFFVVDTHDTKEDAGKFEMLWMADLNAHIDGYNVAYTIAIPTMDEHDRFVASKEKFIECIKHDEELVRTFNVKIRGYYDDFKDKLKEDTGKKPTNKHVVRKERKPVERKPKRFDFSESEVFRQCYQEVSDSMRKPELTNTERLNKLRETFSGKGRKSTMTFEEGMENLHRWRKGGPIQRHTEKMFITADGLIRPQVTQRHTIDNYKSPWGKSNRHP